MKRIIDAGVPVVFAGLPKVRTYLTSEHPDILSRLKTLVLYPIVVEDFGVCAYLCLNIRISIRRP